MSKTLFEKIWEKHIVQEIKNGPTVLYIDKHFIHEVTSPQAFAGLEKRGLKVFRPKQIVATADHNVPTINQHLPISEELSRLQVEKLIENCKNHEIELYGLGHAYQGIVHVIGPELGITQPGMTIVCGDSHTSTHGAFGSIAFGIGTSEVEMVMATQTLLQSKPKLMRINIEGDLQKGVVSKDIILYILAKISAAGATGYFVEYAGSTIRNLSMEARMTICNMSIEMGARGGMIAPDEITFNYIQGRTFAPQGFEWDAKLQTELKNNQKIANIYEDIVNIKNDLETSFKASKKYKIFIKNGVSEEDLKSDFDEMFNEYFNKSNLKFSSKLLQWKELYSDADAKFDIEIDIDAADIQPMITYGTNPGMGIKINDSIPLTKNFSNETEQQNYKKSLLYMGLQEGQKLAGMPIQHVFIGSCTNSRIEDLRMVAQFIKGKKKHPNVQVMIVPGSQQVAKQLRLEGLDKIFEEAGYTIRQAGCSACLGMNEDKIPAGEYCVSTSNRNFEGRQGTNARTLLASPLTAAVASVVGVIEDVRKYI